MHLGNKEKPLSSKRCQFHRTSDTHLVYCRCVSDDKSYLLITILSPDGQE
ncbi:type II toxin-antitoxin system YafO family toxin [Paraglaciecola chathamensis]|uniref:Type II toxin-antitoxin system YafO family toxin n=1 Tax=Paraglaciecola chathamensis TaxID=368405 RepID=A0ABS0WDA9_9ALTE|nr:type II toxin-antitoxin system YafO family toxin [Paraglaciecola chathamensis]